MYIANTPQNCPDFRGAHDWTAHNAGVTPEFFIETTTREDGEEFKRECVTLRVAGDTLTEASMPVDAQIRDRFADAYAAWKEGLDQIPNGTPVAKWSFLTARQASALEAMNCFTVEALAGLTDANVQNVFDGRALREKATAWLKTRAESALKDENARLLARLDALEKGPSAPVKANPKRAPMSQSQREMISARMKERWRKGTAAETSSVAEQGAESAVHPENLTADLTAG